MLERSLIMMVDLLCVSPYYDLELVRALCKAGGRADLASIAFHLDPDLFERSGITRTRALIDRVARLRIRSPQLRRALKLVEYLANLRSHLLQLRRGDTQVVHIQWLPLLDWIDLELIWVAKVRDLGIPIVLTVHNLMPHEDAANRHDSFARLYRTVDRLICHTHATKRRLIEEFAVPEERICVIPHGPLFSDATGGSTESVREALGYPEAQTIALCLGTIKPYKGLDVLVEAWKEVQSQLLQARLVIAGNGESRAMQDVRDMARRRSVLSSVDLRLGPLSTADVAGLHYAADVVVLPYRAITQSGALMTAMSFGKAIIATDLSGFREYLGDGDRGLLVPEGDARALAVALCRVLGDEVLRRHLAQRTRLAVESEFSWSTIADATLRCYSHARKRS